MGALGVRILEQAHRIIFHETGEEEGEGEGEVGERAVSYTHLDVYKRQTSISSEFVSLIAIFAFLRVIIQGPSDLQLSYAT